MARGAEQGSELRLVAAIAFAALAACGRIGFASEDAGPGRGDAIAPCNAAVTPHDEDGDGIDDACDVCPGRADPLQPDADGDRIGDVCDSEPAVPRQHLVFFDPFLDQNPRWDVDTNVTTFGPDAIHVADTFGTNLFVDLPVADVDYEIGGEVLAVDAAPAVLQLFLGVSRGNGPLWYGEAFDDRTTNRRVTVLYADGNYDTYGNQDVASLFATGPFRLRLSPRVSPAHVDVHIELGGQTFAVGGDYAHSLAGGDQLHIWCDGLEVSIHYAVLIETR